MKRLLAALVLLLLPTLSVAQSWPGGYRWPPAQGYIPFSGGLWSIPATYGAELAPALAPANWTCGAGWDCSVAGTLNKNADGTGGAAPNPALTITSGLVYRVSATITRTAGSMTSNTAIGGTSLCWGSTPSYTACTTSLTASGTYYANATAASTASFLFAPSADFRGTITAVSVTRVTGNNLEVPGTLTVRSPATFNGPIYVPSGSAMNLSISAAAGVGVGFDANSTYAAPSLRVVSGGTEYAFLGAISSVATLRFTADTYLARIAANHLGMKNGATAQTFSVANKDDGAGIYERFESAWSTDYLYLRTTAAGAGAQQRGIALNGSTLLFQTGGTGRWTIGDSYLNPGTSDLNSLGSTSGLIAHAYLSRSIQGSKSKALVDNTATAFVRVAVADDDYEAGRVDWVAYAEDADTDARQVRSGNVQFACLNSSGTESCVFSTLGTGDTTFVPTAGTLACSFTSASVVADTIDLRATCDTSLDAAAETLTFEWRLDVPTVATLTPQ
jgi:hypothetical protein